MKINILKLTYEELEGKMIEIGEPKYRAQQIWSWIYEKATYDFDQMSNIKKEVRQKLTQLFTILEVELVEKQVSKDGTIKLLLKLHDDQVIETVLMRYKHGQSICVTTQVGCKIGCSFCASGVNGLERNLSFDEIISQILYINEILKPESKKVTHIVVMGIGEPFDNYDNLVKFLNIANNQDGLNIGARHITISTSGIVPKIYEFADLNKQYNLAVSLHAPNNEIRSKIMKINKAYPIEQLIKSLEYYQKKTNRRITFEYIMIHNINDKKDNANELVQLIKKFNCHVNLIPYNNVFENLYQTSKKENIQNFYEILLKNKIKTTVRVEKGSDIDAACGQLRAKYQKAN